MKNAINLKNKTRKLFLITAATTSLFTNINCSKDETTPEKPYVPTAQAYDNLEQGVLNNLTQNFSINANGGNATITTSQGTQIIIPTGNLTLANTVVTGTVNVKVIEIYDAGNMALTNKVTMGNMGSNILSMLVSGGEFYIEAKQNNQALSLTAPMTIKAPTALTGGTENGMLMFDGVIAQNGDLNWNRAAPGTAGGQVGVQGPVNTQFYNAIVQQFGWSNVDKFYSFVGPKTQILASAPSGYDYSNSMIYLHYDGEASGLARLDIFQNNLFSEHYGQIPIGLACHIIFMTEDNGQWRYAIKPVTISANATYNFTLAETVVGNSAQLSAAINALP